jgi:hypothetical protein
MKASLPERSKRVKHELYFNASAKAAIPWSGKWAPSNQRERNLQNSNNVVNTLFSFKTRQIDSVELSR